MELDREARQEYDLLVECADHGDERLVAVERLRVVVSDINDHYPQFDKAKYVANIAENNYEGAFILLANATDRDQGPNSEIQYLLPPEVTSTFQVDAVRGKLTAKVPLDREKSDQFRFYIIAKDHGTPAKSGSVLVIVNVDDVNDEKPTFTQDTYTFSVPENQPAGTVVGNVTAIDRDKEPFNTFQYGLSPARGKSDALDCFTIDQAGVIRTRRPLNREVSLTYQFFARATDFGERPLNNSAAVIVHIGDVNDNEPIFVFPNSSNYSITIPGLAPVGYSVTRVVAKDADEARRLSYRISRGNEQHMFSLNQRSGVITVNKNLMNARQEWYKLEISVSDSGDEPHSVAHPLHIHVNKSAARPGGAGNPDNQSFLYTLFRRENKLTLVVCIAAISGLIAIILIIAILFIIVRRRRRIDKNAQGRYNCRQEEEKKILEGQQVDGGYYSTGRAKKGVNFTQQGGDVTGELQKEPQLYTSTPDVSSRMRSR